MIDSTPTASNGNAPKVVTGASSDKHERGIRGAWLLSNVIALAAVAAGAPPGAAVEPLTTWAAFIVLNAVLYLALGHPHLAGRAASNRGLLDTSLATLFGLAWGGAAFLILPHASDIHAMSFTCVAVAMAALAIPVFGGIGHAYRYFLAAQLVVGTAATIVDGRYSVNLLWIVFFAAALWWTAAKYYHSLDTLRRAVQRFLNIAATTPHVMLERARDVEIAGLADEKLGRLHNAFVKHERQQRILHAVGDAIIATSARGSIEYVNAVAEVLVGRDCDEVTGFFIDEVLRLVCPPDKHNQTRAIFEQTLRTGRVQTSGEDVQLIRCDGLVYGVDYVVSPLTDRRNELTGAVFVIRDVTEKRHRAETIAWQATHDPLTGAINRTEFEIRLKKLVRRAHDQPEHTHCLLYIDIDKFKFVNDSYGHAAGDATLKALADILRARIRGADTLARLGGDEFVALLYSCSSDKARLIAEGLREAVSKYEFSWHSIELSVSISVGVIEINSHFEHGAEILRAADTACYAAKKSGRNRVHVLAAEHLSTTHETRAFDLVKDVQSAIHRNGLQLFYQPLCCTTRSLPSDLCALSVGIPRGRGELIPPAALDELAMRYHLTAEIDRWVIKAAIDALRLNHPSLCAMDLVLVPISQQSLNDEDLLDYVVESVKEAAPCGRQLGFVLDEPGLVAHLDYARCFVATLKQLGCRFMINDLGFGGEAIESIKMLEADFLGICGSLIARMQEGSVEYELVLALARIARALGMRTIAEGAQSQTMRDALTSMGVDFVKGVLNEDRRRVSIYDQVQWV